MTKPAILVASRDTAARGEITGRLIGRYSDDYEIIVEPPTSAATTALGRFVDEARQVALILVDGLGSQAASILRSIRERQPTTQRGLVISMADWVGAISLSDPEEAQRYATPWPRVRSTSGP